MDLDFIHSNICSDFDLTTNLHTGKDTCRHRNGKFCELGSRFVCEIPRYKDRQKPHISVSQITTYCKCPFSYFLSYVLKLKTPVRPHYFWAGGAFGDCVGNMVRGMKYVVPEIPANCDAKLEDKIKMEETLRFWEPFRAQIPRGDEPEAHRDVYVPGIREDHEKARITCYLDDLLDNGDGTKTIIEYKYSVKDYKLLDMRRQGGLYLAAIPEAKAFLGVVFNKLKHKMKSTESVEAFRDRIRSILAERGVSGNITTSEFKRREFPIQAELEQIKTVISWIDELTMFGDKAGNQWPRNYWSCDMCQYAFYCKEQHG